MHWAIFVVMAYLLDCCFASLRRFGLSRHLLKIR